VKELYNPVQTAYKLGQPFKEHILSIYLGISICKSGEKVKNEIRN
jgi:hypothetical protein